MNQESLTKIFLTQWNKSTDPVNVKLYAREWWFSNRSNQQNNLRLSTKGFHFLTNILELKANEVPFTEEITLSPQTIIFLGRYLDCPYYLTKKSMFVFSEKKSLELYLFSNDIRRYGLIKAMKSRLNEKS